jgi:HEAT repeat protein
MNRVCMIGVAVVGALVLAVDGGCAARRKAQANAKPAKVSAKEVERFRSAREVEELRSRAAVVLEQLTADANPQVRANAIEALAEVPQRLEVVVHRALSDPNIGVRSTAALMVGRLELRSCIGSVKPLVRDASPFVVASALFALARCGERVDLTPLATMVMTDPSTRVRAHAAYLLGELREVSAAGLLRDAAKASMPKAQAVEYRLMQLQIAEALVKLGDDSQLEVIRAALYPSRPEDLEAAALAAQIIGLVGDRRAIDQLIYLTAYNDPKEGRMPAEVRMAAAVSLAQLGNDRGGFIADEYAGSPNPALRAQAAMVYGSTGRPENLPRLEKLMSDPDGVTRVSAAVGALRAGAQVAQQLEPR